MNQRLCDSKVFISQSPRSTMMSRIIENSYGHHLKNLKIILSNENSCTTCSQGKLALRPSDSKIGLESLLFLQIIQADICGLISPSSGLFHYFMVLIDAFDSSHMFIYYLYTTLYLLDCLHKLLSYLHNFKIIQTMLVSLRLKLLVILQFFGIDIEHPISHIHTQKGLVESFIKLLQLIIGTLLFHTQLPIFAYGHTILHAMVLIPRGILPITNIPHCNQYMAST